MSPRSSRVLWALLSIALVSAPAPLSAQGNTTRRCIADRAALDVARPLYQTTRDTACLSDGLGFGGPEALVTQAGGVADGRGNGGAPAAAGRTLQLRVAAEYQWEWLRLRLAPELTSTENAPFLTFAAGDPSRSGMSSPFYFADYSADLPSRHGTAAITQLDLGESGIWAAGKHWLVGATTALPDWGPGVGEGIVLGRSAAGMPRLEASWRQSLLRGDVELRWFGAAAVESRFFDTDRQNNLRGVAGARLSYARPLWRAGISRTVMDGRRDRAPLAASLQPLTRASTDSVIEMLAADLRFHHAGTGSLLWMEFARQAPVTEFRDVLLLPSEGLAIRLGMSQVFFARADRRWVLGFEALRMELPPQRADREDQDFYTSPTVAHGWTHRGEPLGSGLGPGGQRQMFSLDRETNSSSIGLFMERARWNDDALYRQPLPYMVRHDVSVQGGLRVAFQGADLQWRASFSGGRRLNYLFQNAAWIPGYRSDDRDVYTFTLSMSPLKKSAATP